MYNIINCVFIYAVIKNFIINYIIFTITFISHLHHLSQKTKLGENHEKITYYNKIYTKITLLVFIRKPYTNNIIVFYQEPIINSVWKYYMRCL